MVNYIFYICGKSTKSFSRFRNANVEKKIVKRRASNISSRKDVRCHFWFEKSNEIRNKPFLSWAFFFKSHYRSFKREILGKRYAVEFCVSFCVNTASFDFTFAFATVGVKKQKQTANFGGLRAIVCIALIKLKFCKAYESYRISNSIWNKLNKYE